MWFKVQPAEPAVLGMALLVLLVTALIAAYIPARARRGTLRTD